MVMLHRVSLVAAVLVGAAVLSSSAQARIAGGVTVHVSPQISIRGVDPHIMRQPWTIPVQHKVKARHCRLQFVSMPLAYGYPDGSHEHHPPRKGVPGTAMVQKLVCR